MRVLPHMRKSSPKVPALRSPLRYTRPRDRSSMAHIHWTPLRVELAASVLFGLLHPLGAAYIVWATAAGAGLGALAIASGGLVAPIAAHGTYNLLALAYLRRRSTRPDTR